MEILIMNVKRVAEAIAYSTVNIHRITGTTPHRRKKNTSAARVGWESWRRRGIRQAYIVITAIVYLSPICWLLLDFGEASHTIPLIYAFAPAASTLHTLSIP